MSLEEIIQNYWQTFIIAPVAFGLVKLFSLNAKVAVHQSKIATLENAVDNLCKKHDETNNLLREIKGALDERFKK